MPAVSKMTAVFKQGFNDQNRKEFVIGMSQLLRKLQQGSFTPYKT